MSHVTHSNEFLHNYNLVIAGIQESRVTCMNAVWHIYGWVMSHTYEWLIPHNKRVMWHIWMGRVTHERVVARIWSHVTHMNKSCHAYEWVVLRIWSSRIRHMNESCHTYEWVISDIWMSHDSRLNWSCHTYEWVMSHIWMSHVKQMNEPWRPCDFILSQYTWHD